MFRLRDIPLPEDDPPVRLNLQDFPGALTAPLVEGCMQALRASRLNRPMTRDEPNWLIAFSGVLQIGPVVPIPVSQLLSELPQLYPFAQLFLFVDISRFVVMC